MKTKIILILCILSVNSIFGYANFNKETQPVVKSKPFDRMFAFNPLAMIMGGFELGYEAVLTPKNSFCINAGYYLSEEAGFLDLTSNARDMSGFRFELQYRFYKKPNNYIKNVFFAPFVNVKTQTAYLEDYLPLAPPNNLKLVKKSATNVGIGYLLGSRTSIYENIYLDLGIGGGIYVPVSGDGHKDFHIGLFSPFKKGVQFKAYSSILIAL